MIPNVKNRYKCRRCGDVGVRPFDPDLCPECGYVGTPAPEEAEQAASRRGDSERSAVACAAGEGAKHRPTKRRGRSPAALVKLHYALNEAITEAYAGAYDADKSGDKSLKEYLSEKGLTLIQLKQDVERKLTEGPAVSGGLSPAGPCNGPRPEQGLALRRPVDGSET